MLHVHFNSHLDGFLIIYLGDNTNEFWFLLSHAALDLIIHCLHFVIPHSAGLFLSGQCFDEHFSANAISTIDRCTPGEQGSTALFSVAPTPHIIHAYPSLYI
jgi:hypothetical protein